MTWAGVRMRKLLALRRDDWMTLAQAYWLLLLIPVGLRMTSLKVLAAALARPRGGPDVAPDVAQGGFCRRDETGSHPSRAPSLEVERVAYLVGLAARYQPYRPTCLVKALATYALLHRRGRGVTLVIGARRDAGQFRAHAWVERSGGAVVSDPGEDRWSALGAF